MQFTHAQEVLRDRRRTDADPYNPDRVIPADWTDPVTITLPGAWIAAGSSSALPDASRTQVVTTKSLYLTDPAADVQVGDRIRSGGVTYQINEIPQADVNPFTGWRPVLEVPLVHVRG